MKYTEHQTAGVLRAASVRRGGEVSPLDCTEGICLYRSTGQYALPGTGLFLKSLPQALGSLDTNKAA